MYWSCSIMQSTCPLLIHPTAIVFSGAHLYVTLGARLFMELGYSCTWTSHSMLVKGDNWSVKGPTKNPYIFNAEVVLLTTSGFKILRFTVGPFTFKIQSPKLALAPRLYVH